MEQMYLVEIFIDTVTVYASEADASSGANKKLIVKIKFGPKVQFIIKECQLALNGNVDDVMECDAQGRRKWTRTIRVGKSYLFPSYPDTVLTILSKFPLEIEVWNDDENEKEIFVGIGTMHWETQFYHYLKETADTCRLHEPLAIKQRTPLFAECCCRQCGEISFILRLSALGDSIITEFQQLLKDPDAFAFRTNKAPSMFQCKRIEGDNRNFCMVGSLYETTTLEDPDIENDATKKIEVCTELQSCSTTDQRQEMTCKHGTDADKMKKYPLDKIRMGDITGPCGNTNCPLAHKVKTYIRNLDTYKKLAGNVKGTKDNKTHNVCGACICKDDRWHRDECPDKKKEPTATCSGCGGATKPGDTCEDKKKQLYGTGFTPKTSKTNVAYVFSVTSVPEFRSMYNRDYIVEDCYSTSYNFKPGKIDSKSRQNEYSNQGAGPSGGCCCGRSAYAREQVPAAIISSNPNFNTDNKPSKRGLDMNNPQVYNVVNMTQSNKQFTVYNCTDIPEEKDCKCNPPKPSPPCKTFDCECLTETLNVAARKNHKPYCPSYKHKSGCPVTTKDEDDKKKVEEDEDEAEPLPYGLPPIQLGPCPIMGRPCTVPDGFSRMYKTAALPPQPVSYSDAGKVCCSKEYERIKKAIKEYMKNKKESDFRCINKFDVDTEKRCCDKEQVLMSLMGKACCGSHKMAILDKYKDKK